ncbi:MAG: FAS1-like dehydratase domain-containing protein [Pyrinomonadaceae bacterium]
MQIGDYISWQRTFTEADIRAFTALSGDAGEHHLQPDTQGRLMAHGLLTATIPTKIGGDMNFIAREMTFQFHRPVFSGDTITCDVTVSSLEVAEQLTKIATTFICRNQHGKEVMTGIARGVIRST